MGVINQAVESDVSPSRNLHMTPHAPFRTDCALCCVHKTRLLPLLRKKNQTIQNSVSWFQELVICISLIKATGIDSLVVFVHFWRYFL